MRIRDKVESEVIEYYRNKKKKEQLEYEIGLLEKSNEDLIKYSGIEKDELINRILNMDSVIAQLNQEEKELCELRYKKRMEYQSIAYSLNVSRSTICRRIQALVKNLKAEYQ